MKFLRPYQERYVREQAEYEQTVQHLHWRLEDMRQELCLAQARINAQINHATEGLGQLRSPSWIRMLINPLAEEIQRHFPGSVLRLSGPLGIGAQVQIALYKEGTESDRIPPSSALIGYIVVEPGVLSTGEVYVRDLKADTSEYSPGTIGEMNGFNHPRCPLPDTVEELIERFFVICEMGGTQWLTERCI